MTKRMLTVAALALPLAIAGCNVDMADAPVTTTTAAAQTATPVIHISGATYRADGGGSCKTDKQVRRFCEGRNSCDFKVKNTNLCGDPAPGKVKLLEVTYKCQVNGRNLFGSKTVTKSEGKHLRMSCPSS